MHVRQNALHFATSKANLSTVRTLIANKCSARVKDKRGQLPLHRAAAIGSTPIIKVLLEDGKSPVNATDMDGLTALHHAVSEGHGDAAITLLKAGAEADKRDSNGVLAIDMAPDNKVSLFLSSCLVSCCWSARADCGRCGAIFCKRLRGRELNYRLYGRCSRVGVKQQGMENAQDTRSHPGSMNGCFNICSSN